MMSVNNRSKKGSIVGIYKNKKSEQRSDFFSNITMNLTYLCYGFVKVRGIFTFKKGVGQTPKISGLKAVIVKQMGRQYRNGYCYGKHFNRIIFISILNMKRMQGIINNSVGRKCFFGNGILLR
jgi:hypothetical protein